MADTDEDYLGQDDEDEPLARRPVQMPQPVQATSPQSITGASMAPPQVQPTSITSAPKQPLDMPRTGGPLDMSVAPTRPTPAADRLSSLEATPSGVSQKHGVLGGLLKGLDTAGSFLLPELAVNVPGSTLNRQHQINEAAKEAQGESILGKNAADVLHTGAETGELGAETGELGAKAGLEASETQKNAAEAATAGKGTWKAIPETNSEQNDVTGETRQMQGVTPLPARTLPEQQMPLSPDQVNQLNKQFGDRWQALNPGKSIPSEFNLQPGATIGDYSRVSDSLKSAEGIAGTQAQRKQTDEESKQRLALQENPAGETFNRTIGENAAKDVATAQGADFRFRSMNDSYPKALNGDQQAMLNLLANHIGMTMGLQKGARITQALLNEAVNSTPWLQHVEASFDRNGYLSGVKLTPMQMTQMMDLAKDQRVNAWQQAHDSAGQAGVLDKVKVPTDIQIPAGGGEQTGANASPSGADQRPPDKPGFKTQSRTVNGQKEYRQVPIAQ